MTASRLDDYEDTNDIEEEQEEDQEEVKEVKSKSTAVKKDQKKDSKTQNKYDDKWNPKETFKKNVIRLLESYPPLINMFSLRHHGPYVTELLKDLKNLDDKTTAHQMYDFLEASNKHHRPDLPKATGEFNMIMTYLKNKLRAADPSIPEEEESKVESKRGMKR